jgi:hypothetical protein
VGFVWRTYADPEGNVFDIMQAQQLRKRRQGDVFAAVFSLRPKRPEAGP